MQPIYKQRLGKHVPTETNRHAKIEENRFLLGPPQGYIARTPWPVECSDVKQLVSEWESSVVSWMSVCEGQTGRLVWNGRQPGIQLVEGWQLGRALQERLRRDGAIVELTGVQAWDIRRTVPTWTQEAEEPPLLEAVARDRLLRTKQAGKYLSGAVVICKVWRLARAL
jgi:hypothetical protein